jgi:tetratricopeptide (TPR) repeat protein
MSIPLDLSLTLGRSPAESVFSMSLRCDALGLGPVSGTLTNPMTVQERELLRWYLEEYWRWPYDEFARRGRQVEELLVDLGKRLYHAISNVPEANSIVQAWRLQPNADRQISILTDVPAALSIPWELVHDEQGFLALRTRQPISILRRLPQGELAALPIQFEPPLRVLLVTARPENVGFVDPRGIARELLDELQNLIELGSVQLEFLRPPTLAALRKRLGVASRLPIHVLHFDGHGTVEGWRAGDERVQGGDWRGQLAFEDESGEVDAVPADTLAQVLQDSGVKLAVLTACQSALGRADDAFSSVAARLIRSGVDAVAAMSASILVASSARYAEAFYHALGTGVSAPLAQERARQALHDNPRRHVHRRRRDEEGQPVELRDWWLPHFYQQRAVTLHPVAGKRRKKQAAPAFERLNPTIPDPPKYGFGGRARELLQIERWLFRRKLVIIHGFGGVGKTALVREAADWLTRTGMYASAFLHSFEHGGDAGTLLSALGRYLDVYNGEYDPSNAKAAVNALRPVLRSRPLLLLADNMESVLSGGDAALDAPARAQLWNVLMELKDNGVGVLLTSRDINFGDARLAGGRHSALLQLAGLHPEDAYLLASRLLLDQNVDRRQVPYAGLRDLLAQIDHHPLAIQLVLPALRDHTLESIHEDFANLLPQFSDDFETGRNRSLLASLEYSLRRLTDAERRMLLHLRPFESGGLETGIPVVAGMSKEEWANLRAALEQAALVVPEQIHETMADQPFIRFHPVLTPYLRAERGRDPIEERNLNDQYINWYFIVGTAADGAKRETASDEQGLTELLRREIPNFRRTLRLLLERGDLERASNLTHHMGAWFARWGWLREREELQGWLEQAIKAAVNRPEDEFSGRAWEVAHALAEGDVSRNDFGSAVKRYSDLLVRIEALPETDPLGPGSFTHLRTLYELAAILRESGQWAAAKRTIQTALTILRGMPSDDPKYDSCLETKPILLSTLGDILFLQGAHAEARAAYEEAIGALRSGHDVSVRARLHAQLGSVALREGDYESARTRLTEALGLFRSWGDRASEAIAWNQLGGVEEKQKLWSEAERCYRESLRIKEEQGNLKDAASTYANLAHVAEEDGRYVEAEGWHRRALATLDLPVHEYATLRRKYVEFLLRAIQAGRAQLDRLGEARANAESALAAEETLDTAPDIWRTLGQLATIAEMEGQLQVAREYRRRESDSAVASDEIRRVVDQGGIVSRLAYAISHQSAKMQEDLNEAAASFDESGETFVGVGPALRRMWEGERDRSTLTKDLNTVGVVLITRVLDSINQFTGAETTPERALASLPAAVRDAIERGDGAEIERVVRKLSPYEKDLVFSAARTIEQRAIDSFRPLAQSAAEVALGNVSLRGDVERALLRFPRGIQLRDVVRRIWAGERNAEALTEGLSNGDEKIVLLVLETVGELDKKVDRFSTESDGVVRAIAAAAVGNARQRSEVDAMLSQSDSLAPLHKSIRQIWTGERDLAKLTPGLTFGQIVILRDTLRLVNEWTEPLDDVIKQAEPLLRAIAAVALGNDAQRPEAELLLKQLEQAGLNLKDPVSRIWAGERDSDALTADFDALGASLVRRVLALIARAPSTVQSFLKSPEPYLRAIANIARGREGRREEIEELLTESENEGLKLSEPVHKIWAGERDEVVLTTGLSAQSAAFVNRVLEVLNQPDDEQTKTRQEVLSSLPSNVRDAWERHDNSALRYSMLNLSKEEKERIGRVLGSLERSDNWGPILEAGMPILDQIAAVALGFEPNRAKVEELLPKLEETGVHIGEAIHRIWAGERNVEVLTSGLPPVDAALVKAVLELIRVGRLVPLIVQVALEDETPRSEIEGILLDLEAEGSRFRQSVHRIWAGERDRSALCDGLDAVSAVQISHILEMIEALLKQIEPLLQKVAAVAKGDESSRAFVDTFLESLPNATEFRQAVNRIWAGERSPVPLTENLNRFHSSLVVRILEHIGPETASFVR